MPRESLVGTVERAGQALSGASLSTTAHERDAESLQITKRYDEK